MMHLGDITKLNGAEIPVVDVITGGSPCQDLSVAGKRAGLAGERSGLFMEQIRIVKEMRQKDVRSGRNPAHARPRYMVWENVPGAFSSGNPKGADFAAVLEEIIKVAEPGTSVSVCIPNGGWTKSGCYYAKDGSWSIAWRVHDAQFWGVPQRRKRIALVADFGGLSAPEILFERKGLSGDSEPCGAQREETAGTAGDSTKSASGVVSKGNGEAFLMREKASSLTIGGGQAGQGYPCVIESLGEVGGGVEGAIFYDAYQHHGWRKSETSGTLTVGQNNTERGDTPLITAYGIGGYNSEGMKSQNPHSGIYEASTARTLDLNGGNPACNQGGIAVVQSAVYDARGNGDGKTVCTITGDHQNCVTDYTALCVCNGQLNQMSMAEQANTLDTMHDQQAVMVALRLDNCSAAPIGGVEVSPTIRQGAGPNGCANVAIAAVQSSSEIAHTLKAKANLQLREDSETYLITAVDCRNGTENPDINGTLQAKSTGGIGVNFQNVCRTGSVVRRLTPLECERLQGYPDGWTDIGDWVDSNGKKHKAADSPRYKALGNSIALPFWFWLLRRISAQYERPATLGSLFDGIGGFPLCWELCNGKGTALWASEIEEFPIAVTKIRFSETERRQQ